MPYTENDSKVGNLAVGTNVKSLLRSQCSQKPSFESFSVHTCESAEESHRLGKVFGESLETDSVVAFFGDLGAGKTTFIRGLAEGVGLADLREICSPTFNLLNIYFATKTIYHFDLYRLPNQKEFFEAGFGEYLHAGGICCIEWAEKIKDALPYHTHFVSLSYLGEQARKIEIR